MQEQTKIIAIFLCYLRFVFSSYLLSRELALQQSYKERYIGELLQERIQYSLGFSNTLPKYGYYQLEPRIDQNRLQFQSAIIDNMLFSNNVLQGQYLRRGRQVQEFFEITRRIEVALEQLKHYKDNKAVRLQLISQIVYIYQQQFCIDVI